MWGYLGRRILATIPVVLIVAVLIFLMLRLTPGDPAAVIAGDAATSADVAEIREKLGLSGSIVTQFFIWVGHALQGDFGESFFYKKTRRVADRRPDRADAGAGDPDHHPGDADRGAAGHAWPPTARARGSTAA